MPVHILCHNHRKNLLKEEVKRLYNIDVMEKVNNSKWASPAFVIKKTDGTLQSLADMRALNKVIKRSPFPLPRIQEMLQKLEGFMWTTFLDLNMGYYHIKSAPFLRKLCTIVFPWGKYSYNRLPMGLLVSADTFQGKK